MHSIKDVEDKRDKTGKEVNKIDVENMKHKN